MVTVLFVALIASAVSSVLSVGAFWHSIATRRSFNKSRLSAPVFGGRFGRNLGRPESEKSEFLTKDERREIIAANANSPESIQRMRELAESQIRMSPLIPPDPQAQSDQVAWRNKRRNRRGF